jgi:hypothetical protein
LLGSISAASRENALGLSEKITIEVIDSSEKYRKFDKTVY